MTFPLFSRYSIISNGLPPVRASYKPAKTTTLNIEKKSRGLASGSSLDLAHLQDSLCYSYEQ